MNAEGCLEQDVDARITAWLSAVESVPPDGFTPIERVEDLPPQARADSFFWCDSIFRSELNPYNEGLSARHALHAATGDTPDLLRHEYAAGGLSLTVTEGRNFILIQVDRSCLDILSLGGPDRVAAVRQVAEALFNPGGDALVNPGRQATPARAVPVGCPPPGVTPVVEEGASFSSNPAADPALLAYWTDRTECGVQGGRLYFLCYKKSSQLAGYANASQWFDDWRSG
ncbi:hypothetical protein SOCEGT47_011810 [Sorangium cellulosum]|uniref:Uncharacterized protein n=1 Tax=Sorangium cellulosum TaxID=56 RepID=A0A4P2PW14_SORCE|nr:hypothetical protein [Sorangium cellulosum]AUX20708.1 hypothetical protein SOCEGT47_011810 [Sorangium cellulosum]